MFSSNEDVKLNANVNTAGNALGCAAGLAVLETFEKENILGNVNARLVPADIAFFRPPLIAYPIHRSEQLFAALHDLQKSEFTGHMIKDVRGAGLMVGYVAPSTAIWSHIN
jgi:4-aminobutyrate aminotransferase